MKLLGIALRRPSFNEITASTILGVGLWVLMLGVLNGMGSPLGLADAGAALVVVVWSCIAVPFGIHVGRGARHLTVNLTVGAGLLGAYQAAAFAFGG